MKRLLSILVCAALAVAFGMQSTAVAGGGNNDVKLEARMSGKTLASGKAKYEERQKGNLVQQRFKVQVEDFAPGQELTIMLNGSMLGTVTANDLGVAELQFRTSAFIDDPGDGTPIGGDFPPVQPGDSISVGPISGTFTSR